MYRNLRIPHQFLVIRSNGNDFSIEGEGALFVLFCHYKTGLNYIQLSRYHFGGDSRLFTYIIQSMTDFYMQSSIIKL